MRGAHDLHIELELLLESRQGPVERVLLGNEQEFRVDRALAPAEQDGGRPPGQVDVAIGFGLPSERIQEASEPLGIG
jgi:hypothetical protein